MTQGRFLFRVKKYKYLSEIDPFYSIHSIDLFLFQILLSVLLKNFSPSLISQDTNKRFYLDIHFDCDIFISIDMWVSVTVLKFSPSTWTSPRLIISLIFGAGDIRYCFSKYQIVLSKVWYYLNRRENVVPLSCWYDVRWRNGMFVSIW